MGLSNSVEEIMKKKLSQEEISRFHFFNQEKAFINKLTEISESLRFKDREVRKFFLKRDMRTVFIPPFSYIPLCTSLTTFRCVLRTLPNESHAFNTKARGPALVFFEIEEHPDGSDTAGFLGKQIQEYDFQELLAQCANNPIEDLDEIENIEQLDTAGLDDDGSPRPSFNSTDSNRQSTVTVSKIIPKESKFNKKISNASKERGEYWDTEGVGIKKIGVVNNTGDVSITLAPPCAQLAAKVAGNTSTKLSEHGSVEVIELNLENSSHATTNTTTTGTSNTNNVTANIIENRVNIQSVFNVTNATNTKSATVGAETNITTNNNTTATTATATPESHMRPLLDMETFEAKSERLRKKSPYGHLPQWKLTGLIAKSNDDVRQEVCSNFSVMCVVIEELYLYLLS